MAEYPDEALLSSGVAFHVGGCDKTGHPLIIFPTQNHAALAEMPITDLVTFLNYFKLILPRPHRLNGFSYLINLQKAGQQVVSQVVAALNAIQQTSESAETVHCLYAIKPKNSKNVTQLEKLTGLKTSKKNPIKCSYQVHILKDFASLHRSVDKVALTEEFGGYQCIDIAAWVQFRMQVDSVTVGVSRCQGLLEAAKDQMQIMCELEISEDTKPLLESINTKYTAVMGNLNLEHVIDECSSLHEEINGTKGHVKYAKFDLLRDLVRHIHTSQKELTEAREHLQMQWRKAQARVVQTSQLRVHQKNATKISKWIDRNGSVVLTELSQPITAPEQLTSLLQRIKELVVNFQELQRECDYIHTDVEYMALQDLSEVAQSIKSIDQMKTELERFSTNMRELDERMNTAGAVFSNVAKCYSWYDAFLKSLPSSTSEADLGEECKRCLEQMQGAAPPREWLDYIKKNLSLIEDMTYCDNASTLIARIHTILGNDPDQSQELSLRDVNSWRVSLAHGFDSLYSQQLSTTQPALSLVTQPSQPLTKPPAEPPVTQQAKSRRPHKSSRRSLAGAPKLKGASSHVPDSSTDDVEDAEARSQRNKRSARSRKTPTKDGVRVSKGGTQEAYIDLTNSVPIHALPQSLSHVDLGKFLDNEPGDVALASSTPIDPQVGTAMPGSHHSPNQVTQVNVTNANSRDLTVTPDSNIEHNSRDHSRREDSDRKHSSIAHSRDHGSKRHSSKEYSKESSQIELSTRERSQRDRGNRACSKDKQSSKEQGSKEQGSKERGSRDESGRKSRKKRYRRRYDGDDTDDSCPRPFDYLNTTGVTLLSSGSSTPVPSHSVPQNNRLPYHPVTHKEKLERIYKSSSPTLEQKLDMMASLIEEGDESCFLVKLAEPRVKSTTKTKHNTGNTEGRQIGRLTPANISRELSADVTYPEHIYHWLNRQNDMTCSSRENVSEAREDADSVKGCIERAEKILEEGMPTFPSRDDIAANHGLDGYYDYVLDRAVRDSKSGDSGITELTARDPAVLLSNGHRRYTSRESGLDSDMTGNTGVDQGSELHQRHETGTRPRQVPPLRLTMLYSRQRLRHSRDRQPMSPCDDEPG